jgi:site-specific DNA-methyltransferase (adenine-specific)/modification methylase
LSGANVRVIGDATLYLGDCLDILPTLPRVDAVITDPPYGIGASSKKFINGTSKTKKDYYADVCWDTAPPDRHVLDMAVAKGDVAVVWGGNYFNLPPSRCFLVWDKTIHGNSYADCEFAWTNQDANARIKPLNMVAANMDGRVHPTQKPLELMRWCIAQCKNEPQTILDPFMGSGTTGVACAQMGRKFIGIEREPKYFDIACERIERAYAQGTLFDPAERAQPEQPALI